jgi:hypothetical protein
VPVGSGVAWMPQVLPFQRSASLFLTVPVPLY